MSEVTPICVVCVTAVRGEGHPHAGRAGGDLEEEVPAAEQEDRLHCRQEDIQTGTQADSLLALSAGSGSVLLRLCVRA